MLSGGRRFAAVTACHPRYDDLGLPMKKEIKDALEKAIATFEKPHVENENTEDKRLADRQRFEAEWRRIRDEVVVIALEQVRDVLMRANWECDVRVSDRDQGVRLSVHRDNMKAIRGDGSPYINFAPDWQLNTVSVDVATKRSGTGESYLSLDRITEEFVQTRASKFFEHVAREARYG
jgi:hypothetical protein